MSTDDTPDGESSPASVAGSERGAAERVTTATVTDSYVVLDRRIVVPDAGAASDD